MTHEQADEVKRRKDRCVYLADNIRHPDACEDCDKFRDELRAEELAFDAYIDSITDK